MYGTNFYNESTRRYVAVFGTMFNNIIIDRKDNSGTSIQKMKVPVNYAPMQKILARLDQDPNLDAPAAITLPRISFEIVGMSYSPDRKLTRLTKITKGNPAIDDSLSTLYAPAPYDIEFQLNIMTKLTEDGMMILEQILPYFKPDCTVSVKMIDSMDTYVDIPIVLNSVSQEDTYEGDFQTRRALIWTLNFTMKGFYFGPTTNKKQIKFVDVDLYPSMVKTDSGSQIEISPAIPESLSGVTQGLSYKIYDLGTGSPTENQTRWNSYLGTTDIKYRVGDTFTTGDSSNAPQGSIGTKLHTDINIDDDWKNLIVLSDGDGVI